MKKTVALGLAVLAASATLAASPVAAWAEAPGSAAAATAQPSPTPVSDGVKTLTDDILKADSTLKGPQLRTHYMMWVVGLRGQATVRDKGATFINYTWQRGTITAKSSTSVTIASKDGFSQTWTTEAGTRFRRLGKTADLSKLVVGDGVFAIGVPGTMPTAAAVFVPRDRAVLETPSVPAS